MKSLNKFTVALLTLVALLFASTSISNSTNVSHATSRRQFHAVYSVAKSKLGAPYVYGATGSHVFDCSSFTQYVYHRSLHVQLPRTAQQQYYASRRVSRHHVHRGDLVFIGSSRADISHVGLYVGHGKMIDAQNLGVIREKIHAPWWHVVAYGRVA